MAGVSREEPGLGDHSLTIGRRLTLNFSERPCSAAADRICATRSVESISAARR